MSKESGAKVVLGCLVIFLTIPIGILMRGFVMVKLWAWYLVPLGIKEIGVAHAYGLTILLALFTISLQRKQAEEGDKSVGEVVGNALGNSILVPLIFLLAGWLCSLCM